VFSLLLLALLLVLLVRAGVEEAAFGTGAEEGRGAGVAGDGRLGRGGAAAGGGGEHVAGGVGGGEVVAAASAT